MEETKQGFISFRNRLLSNESLCISESEYSSLLAGLSPRHRSNDQISISISFFTKYKGKHIIYKISGKDGFEEFESFRRYNDFLILRSIMTAQ